MLARLRLMYTIEVAVQGYCAVLKSAKGAEGSCRKQVLARRGQQRVRFAVVVSVSSRTRFDELVSSPGGSLCSSD